jgi:hypothetical protein
LGASPSSGSPNFVYFYEACYFVQGDQNLHNNWASRPCSFFWDASANHWQVTSQAVSLTLGPALERWGEMRTYADMASDDGQVLLAVQTTDLGGGMWHYEYALFNRNSDRAIRSFSLPVAGVANITNIGFHDNNNNAGDDWPVTLDAGTIRWSIPAYESNINGNGLTFGSMFNFRFDAQAAPSNVMGVVGPWKSPFIEVVAATKGPLNSTVGVEGTPKLRDAAHQWHPAQSHDAECHDRVRSAASRQREARDLRRGGATGAHAGGRDQRRGFADRGVGREVSEWRAGVCGRLPRAAAGRRRDHRQVAGHGAVDADAPNDPHT